uniref:Uncharacterized protein n=1 Tax=Romanomermis culicivorax TaxID=13658 RepID=A0A915JFJ2_ROMCU
NRGVIYTKISVNVINKGNIVHTHTITAFLEANSMTRITQLNRTVIRTESNSAKSFPNRKFSI